MTQPIEEAILPFKIHQLTNVIMQKKSIPFQDALQYLCDSELYHNLFDEKAKLWYLSGLVLYEMLEKEKFPLKKSDLEHSKETLFLVFCFENYKNTFEKTAEETMSVFSKYQVFDFLRNNFEMLHTQSKEYIIETIADFIKE